MIDEQPTSYTKKPVPGAIQPNGMVSPMSSVTTANTTTSLPASAGITPPSQKKNARRTLLAIIGLVVFLVVASMGVYISLRQRLDDSQLAPNAPESRPSADELHPDSCTLSFDVPGDTPVSVPCATAAFSDSFDSLSQKWQINNVNDRRTATVKNSQLELKVSGNTTTEAVGLETKDLISGDFETEIDLSSLITNNIPNGTGELVLANGQQYTFISVNRLSATSLEIATNNATNNVWQTPARQTITSANVRFKIVKSGNTITTSYKAAGQTSFTTLGTYTVPNEPVKVIVHTHSADQFPTVTALFDNFELKCPGVVKPEPIACAAASFTEEFDNNTYVNKFSVKGNDNLGIGTATASAGRLNITVPVRLVDASDSRNVDVRYALETLKPITGEFETVAQVSNLVSEVDNQGTFNLNIDSDEWNVGGNREAAVISLRKTTGTGRKVVFWTLRNGVDSAKTEQTITGTGPVTLKLVRSANNTITGYYDSGSGMIKVAEAANFAQPLYSRIAMRADGDNTSTPPQRVTGSLERFTVACPTTATTYSCNSTCTTDANCQSVNSSYVCATIGSEKRCRLNTNTSSVSCQTVVTTTPTPTPTPVVTPTPTIGCNNTCINNSDCANPDHICYNNRCRLATAPESASCTVTTVVPTPTPTIGCGSVCNNNSDCSNSAHICYNNTCRLGENPTNQYCAPDSAMSTPVAGQQPVLPAELPQTGPEDWANWLKLGLGVVVVGAVLMLLI